jgi:hypothetical protein
MTNEAGGNHPHRSKGTHPLCDQGQRFSCVCNLVNHCHRFLIDFRGDVDLPGWSIKDYLVVKPPRYAHRVEFTPQAASDCRGRKQTGPRNPYDYFYFCPGEFLGQFSRKRRETFPTDLFDPLPVNVVVTLHLNISYQRQGKSLRRGIINVEGLLGNF